MTPSINPTFLAEGICLFAFVLICACSSTGETDFETTMTGSAQETRSAGDPRSFADEDHEEPDDASLKPNRPGLRDASAEQSGSLEQRDASVADDDGSYQYADAMNVTDSDIQTGDMNDAGQSTGDNENLGGSGASETDSTSPQFPAVCGNGVIEGDEACDDGNTLTEACAYGQIECNVCNEECEIALGQTSFCGDNSINADFGEECDDGNALTEPCEYGLEACLVCNENCRRVPGQTAFCGDGKIDATFGESCDDGNTTTESCRYGLEACDVCNAECQTVAGLTAFCGDDKTDEAFGETCDDGNAVTEACAYGQTECQVCSETCRTSFGATTYCGDNVINPDFGENCDDGNTVTEHCAYGLTECSVCNSNCETALGETAFCGDSTIDVSFGENCDDGNAVTEACAYGETECSICDETCQTTMGETAFCGDNVINLDVGENCDDGNAVTEACNYGQTECQICNARCVSVPGETAYCGDNTLQAERGERCDEGSTPNQDCLYGQESCEVCTAACQTVEGNTSFCGDTITDVSAGESCDDGNANEADRCLETCQFNQPCAALPAQCGDRNNWAPGLDEHYMVSTDGCDFALDAPADWLASSPLIDALVERVGNRYDVTDILNDLNRSGRSGITNQSATRMRNHDWVGFVWNDGDMDVAYWMPQGITGSSDAATNGQIGGRRLLMVSWYNKTNDRPTKGARISLVDITNFNSIRYRHLLLAEPVRVNGEATFRQVEYDHNGDALHAGGIVWYGNYLYVADTREGFRVFDLSRIMRVNHTDDKERIGVSGNEVHALGYRYIIPQLARYRLANGSCPYSFSSVSLDRSTNPPTLTTAEYKSDSIHGRIVHWPLDRQTGQLMDINGQVFGRDAKVAAQDKMQGVQSYNGNYYISSSSQYLNFGRLYRTRPGMESRISAWVYGCEDLYYERQSGLIWTAAEFPGYRDNIGIPLPVP